MQINKLGEIALIDLISKMPNVKGIGDDCAILPLDQKYHLLITTDILIEEVHFSSKTNSWQEIGETAMAVNMSDIAAMGGLALKAFVSLALPQSFLKQDLEKLYLGFAKSKIIIAGGDLSVSNKVIINICLLGKVEKKYLLKKSRAKPGDLIAVTGKLGLMALNNYSLVPKARIDLARKLAKTKRITAMTDISDGLAKAVFEIAKASNTGIEIDYDKVPLARGASLNMAMQMGGDYELLFCFKKNTKLPIKATIIGQVLPKGKGIDFSKLKLGYEHYK